MNPINSIVNKSKTVTDADLKRKLLALQKQITRDFEPVWGWGANLRFNAKKFDMKVIVKDTAGKGGFLGFHIKNGKPITGHMALTNDGHVHYHAVPNVSFPSAIALVRQA